MLVSSRHAEPSGQSAGDPQGSVQMPGTSPGASATQRPLLQSLSSLQSVGPSPDPASARRNALQRSVARKGRRRNEKARRPPHLTFGTDSGPAQRATDANAASGRNTRALHAASLCGAPGSCQCQRLTSKVRPRAASTSRSWRFSQ